MRPFFLSTASIRMFYYCWYDDRHENKKRRRECVREWKNKKALEEWAENWIMDPKWLLWLWFRQHKVVIYFSPTRDIFIEWVRTKRNLFKVLSTPIRFSWANFDLKWILIFQEFDLCSVECVIYWFMIFYPSGQPLAIGIEIPQLQQSAKLVTTLSECLFMEKTALTLLNWAHTLLGIHFQLLVIRHKIKLHWPTGEGAQKLICHMTTMMTESDGHKQWSYTHDEANEEFDYKPKVTDQFHVEKCWVSMCCRHRLPICEQSTTLQSHNENGSEEEEGREREREKGKLVFFTILACCCCCCRSIMPSFVRQITFFDNAKYFL